MPDNAPNWVLARASIRWKEEFERSRRENPEVLNDKLAHEKFDLVLVTLQLEARFRNLRTDYLYVSTESLNDN
jgi:hypothetical protein